MLKKSLKVLIITGAWFFLWIEVVFSQELNFSEEESQNQAQQVVSELMDQAFFLVEQSSWYVSDKNSFSDHLIKHYVINDVKNQLRLYHQQQAFTGENQKNSENPIEFQKTLQEFKQGGEKLIQQFVQGLSLNYVRDRMAQSSQEGYQIYYFTEEQGEKKLEALNIGYLDDAVEIPPSVMGYYVQTIDKFLQKHKIKEVGINMHDNHSHYTKEVAHYLRKNNIDVHILGFCTWSCANYLLPAVQKITIGPYGLIAYSGENSFSYDQYLEIFNEKEKEYDKIIEEHGGLASFVKANFKNQKFKARFFENLNSNSSYAEIAQTISRYKLTEFSEDLSAVNHVFEELSEKNKLLFKGLAYDSDKPEERLSFYQNEVFKNHFSSLRDSEQNFFKEIVFGFNDTHPYYNFLKVITKITQSAFLKEIYPEEKQSQPLEDIKPIMVIPSEIFLNKMGINIVRGFNKPTNLLDTKTKFIQQSFLYLTEQKFNQCQSFHENISMNLFKKCLSQGRLASSI